MQQSTGGRPTKSERQERIAHLERESKRRERRRAVLVWSVVGVVVALLIGALVIGLRQNSAEMEKAAARVKSFKVEADHVAGTVKYEQDPPVGGPHNPVWLNCGTYANKVPNENAVHSLEHGAVWITYDPALSPADVAALSGQMPADYAVLSPYPGLKDPVVASAWGKQFRADGVDDPGLASFISEYTQSSDAPEPGASCSGGSDGTVPLGAAGGG